MANLGNNKDENEKPINEIQKNLKTYSNKRNNRDSFYEKRTKH